MPSFTITGYSTFAGTVLYKPGGEGVEGQEDRLLTVAEVAEYFRVEPESVRRWLREGKLLGINLGRGPGWRIRVGDIEAFIAERHTRAGEQPPDMGGDDEAPGAGQQ
jgi:excisionase family DNA binding protein